MLLNNESRAVPWTGIDVLLFFILWIAVQIGCQTICLNFLDLPIEPQRQAGGVSTENEHSLIPLIRYGKDSPLVLLVALLAAVVAAPLVEEFLFRLLLQGWLEAKLNRFPLPANYTAIVIVSLFFAAIHGGNRKPIDTETLYYMFVSYAAANLLIFASGIAYLILLRKMKLPEILFGAERRFFRPFLFTHLGYCLGAIFFIYVLNIILNLLFAGHNTDPIPVFVLSVVLGSIYSRTRNLSYCVLMHTCLNGISLLIVCLMASQGG